VEAQRDAAAREAILEKLRQKVAKQGPKAVAGNKGYARFLKVAKGSVSVDKPRSSGTPGWTASSS